MKITKSMLMRFKYCEMKSFFVDDCGMREDLGHLSTRGWDVHRAYDAVVARVELDRNETGEDLVKYMRQYLPHDKPDLEVYWDNIAKFEAKRYERAKKSGVMKLYKPLHCERKLDCVDKIGNRDWYLVGIPDLIFKESNKKLLVLELKSGKFNSSKQSKCRLETVFYKHLIDGAKVFSQPIELIGWYFPETQDGKTEEISSRLEARLVKEMEKYYTARKTGIYKRTLSDHMCPYCTFEKQCLDPEEFEKYGKKFEEK